MSEVAMESSPGPSTSSGSRPEADHRAQSSAANTPRAGTHNAHTEIQTHICYCCHWPSQWQSVFLGMQCIPQRAALLKSMLNFLKKAIQDPAFSDGIRHGKSLAFSNLVYIWTWGQGYHVNICSCFKIHPFCYTNVDCVSICTLCFSSNGWVLAYLTQAHYQ